MRFLNHWEVDDATDRFAGHPILGPATRTLANLRDCADANSDGWAYWPKPARAAARLIALIEGDNDDGTRRYDARYDRDRADATAAKLKRAYTPIRAFLTRQGLDCEVVEPAD